MSVTVKSKPVNPYLTFVVATVLEGAARGEGLETILRENRALPRAEVFHKWLAADDSLRQRYLNAVLAGQSAKTHI
jgi:hypothetical protein